jgi:hypothetical protein
MFHVFQNFKVYECFKVWEMLGEGGFCKCLIYKEMAKCRVVE